jgi:hypothetical protein
MKEMKSKTFAVYLLSTCLALTPALAGVVYEIEVKDHQQAPSKTESIEVAVEGKSLKLDILPGESGRGKGKMIFRGDRREMMVVDDDDRSYYLIDAETIQGLAGQVAGMMGQMQEALKSLPESERRKIEEMMKQRMPSQTRVRPKSELRRISETATRNGYPCRKYEVWRDGLRIRELWVTDWSNVEGGSDVAGAFEEMADFFQEMMDAMPDFGQGGFSEDPFFAHMKELGGFPVVTREFGDDGSLEDESALRSARRRTLDPAAFEPPSGYKRMSMGPR